MHPPPFRLNFGVLETDTERQATTKEGQMAQTKQIENQGRTFDAVGSVRGSCGHRHATVETAERCRDRDALACRRLPGGGYYSDRVVRVVFPGGAS